MSLVNLMLEIILSADLFTTRLPIDILVRIIPLLKNDYNN
jgi:hypothetical protein